MGIEELRKANILLPEDLWGKSSVKSRVRKPIFLAIGAVGVLTCVGILVGGGQWLTWICAILYQGFLAALFLSNNREIRIQNQRLSHLFETESKEKDPEEEKK
ncbi:MAG: hypothetical protein P8Y60_12885 [Calditrichota bacterium]